MIVSSLVICGGRLRGLGFVSFGSLFGSLRAISLLGEGRSISVGYARVMVSFEGINLLQVEVQAVEVVFSAIIFIPRRSIFLQKRYCTYFILQHS